MNFDLESLYCRATDSIDISGIYSIPNNYFENSEVINLNEIEVHGDISLDEDDSLYVNCEIKGEMIIPDSISLEEVSYPFQIEYDDILDENFKNIENSLDIFMFLWENIVLEVPLQFTKVKDLSKFHGDGWRLISEDQLAVSNNPFSELLKDYDKE